MSGCGVTRGYSFFASYPFGNRAVASASRHRGHDDDVLLMDTHLSTLGQRTNEVMKLLTIMASIFIPLTFLAGLYG